jgi:putative membrane protein
VSASLPLRGVRWGSVLISALSALISLAVGLWVWDFVAALFTRGGWLGSVALVLAALAGVSALMIASREIAGLWRLGRVAAIREQAASVLRGEGGKQRAQETSSGVENLFAGRAEAAWGLRRLREHRGDVLDARELLILTERELLTPLDASARSLIAASMSRVSVVTAVSPSAIVDVGFVAFANLRMLRQLATLYGGRPGVIGVLRLARLVTGHLLLTGGMAIGDDVLQQLAGHGLTARLSARLGEGLMNGAFTGRIGVAAVELCRPLPFIEAERPRLRDLVSQLRANAG